MTQTKETFRLPTTSMGCQNGNEKAAKMLPEQEEVNPNQPDNNSPTPLSIVTE